MKSLLYDTFGNIDVLRFGAGPRPTIESDEVLVRVLSASINPFDWKLRNGSLKDFFKVGFPITPGRDGCGEVVEIGSTIERSKIDIGQRVVFLSSRLEQGSFAEFVAIKDLANKSVKGAHIWALDPFWRTSNPGVVPRGGDGFTIARKRAGELDNDLLLSDLRDIIVAIQNEETCSGDVVVLGICFPGKFALMLASQGQAAAGASFQGTGLKNLPDLSAIHVPMALHFGDADVFFLCLRFAFYF